MYWEALLSRKACLYVLHAGALAGNGVGTATQVCLALHSLCSTNRPPCGLGVLSIQVACRAETCRHQAAPAKPLCYEHLSVSTLEQRRQGGG